MTTPKKNKKLQEVHTAARWHWHGAEISVKHKHNKGNVEAPQIESLKYLK